MRKWKRWNLKAMLMLEQSFLRDFLHIREMMMLMSERQCEWQSYGCRESSYHSLRRQRLNNLTLWHLRIKTIEKYPHLHTFKRKIKLCQRWLGKLWDILWIETDPLTKDDINPSRMWQLLWNMEYSIIQYYNANQLIFALPKIKRIIIFEYHQLPVQR